MTDDATSGAGDSGAVPEGMSPEELRRALRAFKKRLKLARLEDESRLGGGPMSGGKKSSIVAIQPPNQYPKAVWDELVAKGKLVYSGQGMYELVQQGGG
jgi:hypothetical protein